MENKKIYISQPINGFMVEQIVEYRRFVKDILKENWGKNDLFDEYEFINAYDGSIIDIKKKIEDKEPIVEIAKAIKKIQKIDLVIFPPKTLLEWSKGCQVEKKICEIYNIEHIVLDERWEVNEKALLDIYFDENNVKERLDKFYSELVEYFPPYDYFSIRMCFSETGEETLKRLANKYNLNFEKDLDSEFVKAWLFLVILKKLSRLQIFLRL
ncbi:MAG: hypothetical protein LBT91_01025 [Bifidobacteriaceae bacterium]|jgi:hypothetical protein|nr:hypothetical protein [Bifidobacteriaceae bacterium]